MLDIAKIRAEFPILSQQVNGKPLVYMDNAATSQKPKVVLQAIQEYYESINANIHRGVHTLSQQATSAYEQARELIRGHLNAEYTHEVILTAGTTHSINLVANGFAAILKKGDEILISAMEHHSNIVPWQLACERSGATLKVIPMTETGELDLQAYQQLLTDKTKLVAIQYVSNALGTVHPIEEMIRQAHQAGAAVLVDGAQSAPHMKVDVRALDCEFYAFSGHKICGPTGTGVLYGKEVWLDRLPPYQGGGEMIKQVTFAKTTYASLPHKFEAGTPNISGGIVLAKAVEYLNEVGLDNISKYEKELLDYATQKLKSVEGIRIYGTSAHKTSVISFNLENTHPFDVGSILDKLGIAVRTGHHCTQPIMEYFGISGTVRASLAFYNTREEIDLLVDGVLRAKTLLA
jgi:cysteine desulfurase/selenocysteine lyase